MNPGTGKEGVKEERKVTLEMLVGKLQQGTNTIAGFKEDKRNIVKPGGVAAFWTLGRIFCCRLVALSVIICPQ